MEKFKVFMVTMVLAALFSCGNTNPVVEPDDEGTETILPQMINGSFEDELAGWTVTGNADVSGEACVGKSSLRIGDASKAAEAALTQEIGGFTEGVYDLRFYYKKSEAGTGDCYIAMGSDESSLRSFALSSSPLSWTEGIVRGVRLDGKNCHIKIFCEAEAGGWCQVDGMSIRESSDGEYGFLKGGDISMLSLVEQNGGKYKEDGVEMDCIKLLKTNGFDIVRLRLYNDPGNPDYSPSNQFYAGIQNEEDILGLAKRAKAEGLQIELTFHYSDSWSNGESQYRPHEWDGLDYAALKQKVHDYTAEFLNKMKAQGTLPEYVSLGNETQAGMLYPEGSITDNRGQLCELYNAGAAAVREVAPGAKIIIHSDDAGNSEKYNWVYGEVLAAGQVDYDMIGASYYPFWTNKNVDDIISWANAITDRCDKDIMIMECGFAWNPTLPDGKGPQISHNGPYKDMTKLAQKNFMLELFAKIQMNPDARIAGVLYWDPIFIEAGDAGWAVGQDNVVSNTTLFDFEGNVLEVFDAFRYNK